MTEIDFKRKSSLRHVLPFFFAQLFGSFFKATKNYVERLENDLFTTEYRIRRYL